MKFLCSLFLCLVILAESGVCFAQDLGTPIKVEIVKEKDGYKILRGGEPFFIKGAGGHIYMDRIKAYGGNSLRTWSTDGARDVLDEAHKLGLTVTLGIWVGHERHGFDYDDEWAVKAQLESFRQTVRDLKNHPALLFWGVGNEMDLFYSNYKVWDAVEEIAQMIHEEDPLHPTMVVTAGIDVAEVQLIQQRAPSIDVLGVNTYGGVHALPKQIEAYGWDGPYVVTEWGPNGHWEVFKTEWEAPVEQTSSEKADSYLKRYTETIATDTKNCVGSYVFLWGQKQETTATWYGIFTPEGEETEAVDVLEFCWSGEWPANRTPTIDSFNIAGKNAYQNVYLEPGKQVEAQAAIKDADNDKLTYRWEIVPESTENKAGGDYEAGIASIKGLVVEEKEGKLIFKAPKKEGGYRLFIYAYDGNNNVATGNIPFYVK